MRALEFTSMEVATDTFQGCGYLLSFCSCPGPALKYFLSEQQGLFALEQKPHQFFHNDESD